MTGAMSTPDKKTQELMGTCLGRLKQAFIDTVQTSNEIAEVVKNVILSEKPNFRYQTNGKYNPEEIKAKLSDPSGNDLMEIVKKNFFDAE